MTRILVTGGRNYANVRLLTRTLDDLAQHRAIAVIIHGNAPGADSLAAEWARLAHVPVEAYPADWRRGKGAGPERNARMLAEGKPDLVVAFPGGRGTADMVRRARAAGVRVVEVVEPVTAGGE